MELEMLKQKWNEMDNRLSTIETLNRQTVKELLRTRTHNSIDRIRRTDSLGLIIALAVPLFVAWGLSHEPVINIWTIVLLVAGCYIYLPFQMRRVSLLSHYNVSDSTTRLMELVLSYRKVVNIERLLIIPVAIILSYGIILTEHSWIMAGGKLLQSLLLVTFICVLLIFSQRNSIKRHFTVLQEIEDSLKEIEEV